MPYNNFPWPVTVSHGRKIGEAGRVDCGFICVCCLLYIVDLWRESGPVRQIAPHRRRLAFLYYTVGLRDSGVRQSEQKMKKTESKCQSIRVVKNKVLVSFALI